MTRRIQPFERSLPTGSNNSTTCPHKDRERQRIAAELAAFRKSGGQIEVLGNTPTRRELSRRQINDAAASQRAGHTTKH